MTSAYDPIQMYYAQQEKKAIRENAEKVGLVLLVAFGMQFLVGGVDVLLGSLFIDFEASALSLWLQERDMVGYMVLNFVEYAIYMGVPVLVGWAMFRKQRVSMLPHQKTDGSLGVSLCLLGIGMMVIANMIGSFILSALESVGVTAAEIPEMQDGTVAVLLLNVLMVGILAAILEELLFRGVVLQALRCAGDRVALVCSALLFGMMHGTLYQIPFAIVLGLVFGYIVLKTGNILWAMGLHAVNNTLAVLMEYWLYGVPAEESGSWYLLFFAVEALLGVIGAVVLTVRGRTRLSPVGDRISSWLTRGERRAAVFCSVTILVFLALTAAVAVFGTLLEGLSDLVPEDLAPAIDGEGEQQSACVFERTVCLRGTAPLPEVRV